METQLQREVRPCEERSRQTESAVEYEKAWKHRNHHPRIFHCNLLSQAHLAKHAVLAIQPARLLNQEEFQAQKKQCPIPS
jgi:hypothetical protein